MLLISSNLQDWRHEETVLLFLSVFNMSASINCLKIMTTLDDANKQHYITLCSNNACSKLLTVLLSCLCYIMLHNMRTTHNMHVNLVKDWLTALTSIKKTLTAIMPDNLWWPASTETSKWLCWLAHTALIRKKALEFPSVVLCTPFPFCCLQLFCDQISKLSENNWPMTLKIIHSTVKVAKDHRFADQDYLYSALVQLAGHYTHTSISSVSFR